MKILGIGESVIDKAYILDKQTTGQHVGGPSVISLMFLARLGIDTTLVTSLGKDKEGDSIRKILAEEKIKLLENPQEKTKINTYQINPLDGSRKKIRGNIVHPYIKNLDQKFLNQFDMIIIDRHEPLAFYEIVKKKKSTTQIIIDPSTEVSDFTLDMIRYADYPIIPIEALLKIGESTDLSICLKKLFALAKKTVIVTAGEFGSITFDGKTKEIIPSLYIKAIDVQGAGDIYRGAFAYGLTQGWGIKNCVMYANNVAALHCTKLGNATAIPTNQEIEIGQNILMAKDITYSSMANYFAHI